MAPRRLTLRGSTQHQIWLYMMTFKKTIQISLVNHKQKKTIQLIIYIKDIFK